MPPPPTAHAPRRPPGGDAEAFGCPHCGAPLTPQAIAASSGHGEGEGLWCCASHGVVGRQLDGIASFDGEDTYWGEIPRERMRALLAAARTQGWREAVERGLREQDPDLLDYVQDPTRADWRFLLPLDPAATVSVDIGAGWGANSFGVAPYVQRHYAVEKIPERIGFIALRARQDEVKNVVPVRADLHALPFADASVDVVVVNGVLEWAGLVDPEAATRPARNPRVLQEAFLRRIQRMLRPGGWLYIGIENRFGAMFFAGHPDHQGVRFTSLMPRWAADWTMRWRAARSDRTWVPERRYRAYTYSYGGYRKLLRSTGFGEVRRHAVMPGYNAPRWLIPIETHGPLAYYYTRERSPRRVRGALRRGVHRLAVACGLEARITSTFAIVARKVPA